MKLSIYTFVRNGLFFDYHVVDMLKHHIPFADEIIVHEGFSTDGTFEAIRDLDPKIQIFRSAWDQHQGMDFVVQFKDAARKRCTGDWCILLDCDEFIPEWDWERLRRTLESSDETMLPVNLINFYGSYRVYNSEPLRFRWPAVKMLIHRNVPDIEVWGDGSSVRQHGVPLDWGAGPEFTFHHFGFVRSGARLREKWRNMPGRLYNGGAPWLRIPSFIFNWLPHKWKDPDFLPYLKVYDGPHVKAVMDDPAEFIRDGEVLYKYLCSTRQ